MERLIHEDFINVLKHKDASLVELYIKLRSYVLNHYQGSNELLYHTHALTSVFTVSDKLSDGFCHIAIYSAHLNFGFNKGAILDDPCQLLSGTGKLIRHIPITEVSDFENEEVRQLLKRATLLAEEDSDSNKVIKGQTISKIKK